MALTNNLVLEKGEFPSLAEALTHKQGGDKLTLTIEVTLVENLPARASFDVTSARPGGGSSAPAAAPTASAPTKKSRKAPTDSLAATVLGVMSSKHDKS